jgi:hypothetical protein
VKLGSKPSLYGKLLRLDNVTLEAIMTNGCVAAVDVLSLQEILLFMTKSLMMRPVFVI